jgi:hypothetical protein
VRARGSTAAVLTGADAVDKVVDAYRKHTADGHQIEEMATSVIEVDP